MCKYRFLLLGLLSVSLLACYTVPPPEPVDSERSGVGISINLRLSGRKVLGASSDIDTVYFIRLDREGDFYSQKQHMVSNHKGGSGTLLKAKNQCYLLNARPGRYAVVACLRIKKTSPGAAGGKTGVSVTPVMKEREIIYFSRELIPLTEITVSPGEFVFMGEYTIDWKDYAALRGKFLEEADTAQVHYANLITPKEKGGVLGMMFQMFFGKGVLQLGTGSFVEVIQEEQTEIDFMNQALKHFKDTEWVGLIKKRLAQLESDG